jgi:hypothetical protein
MDDSDLAYLTLPDFGSPTKQFAAHALKALRHIEYLIRRAILFQIVSDIEKLAI